MTPPSEPAGKPAKPSGLTSALLLLVIAYLGFISLGLPDPVAGVAWPSMRGTFGLQQSSFGLVFIGLGCGYCLSGFFGGKLTHFLGLGNLLWVSSALVAVAMLGSGLAPAWSVIVACAVIWGLGSGGIDAGLNAFVGHHYSAKHMNWLHSCYSLGATLGPLLMTTMLVQTGSWRAGYHFVGGLLALMTILFTVTRRQWDDPGETAAEGPVQAVGMRTVLREPLVWMQVVLFFLYVGLEFTVGQWCFTVLTESRGLGADVAGMLAGGYYFAIGVGRVGAGFIAERLGLDRLVRYSIATALLGVALFAFGPTMISSAGLIIIGLGLAAIFPSLMSRTPQRLEPGYATHAVGFQVSAGMLGAALVPGAAGLAVEAGGLGAVGKVSVILALLLCATHEVLLRAAKQRARAKVITAGSSAS